ncbi:unnamed protein product [Symbiodinium natans]|uniref:DUF7869 domain-containing protein n=1 Tax=Symbiodinium natans TaxID=878477 RepID=A0A812LBS1_9DINO|nr:unnamed protein product [Symbiodinium natans]
MAILAAGDADASASDRHKCNANHVSKIVNGLCPYGRGKSGQCTVCEPGLSVDDVLCFRKVFDGMGVSRRAALLSNVYSQAQNGTEGQTRCKWFFLGKRCCEKRLHAMLEMSPSTYMKLLKGQSFDGRSHNGRAVTEVSASVDQFFLEMYHSAAEYLPEDTACHLEDVDWTVAQEELQLGRVTEFPTPEQNLTLLGWDPEKSELQTAIQAASGASMPKKYVQHKKAVDRLYLAWRTVRMPESQSACWSTFWKKWHDRWCHCIGLRKPTQHSQCTQCMKFASVIHYGNVSVHEKKENAKAWQQHLRDQYEDRLIYWHLRWHSKMPDSNILCIIIDGMDKSKGSWPKYDFRKPKSLDKFHRPRNTIHLAIAHGFCADFYIADDENFFHGASFFCEILTRTLARVKKICQEQGRAMPEHLVIQSDNTTAQAKNSEVASFLALLVRRFKFHSCVLHFLQVGHTHEDVDFIFSLLLAKVLRKSRVQIPEDLRNEILIGMTPILASKGCQVNAELVTHCRHFKAWLAEMSVHPHNCWVRRQGIMSPHSFTFKLRMDLTPKEQQLLQQDPTDRGWRAHPFDVFCIVKTFMASQAPNGPPVLLIPESRFQRITTLAPTATCPASEAMSVNRKRQLRQFADELECLTAEWGPEHSMFRAAQELRILADGRNQEPSQDGYLEAVETERQMPLTDSDGSSVVSCQSKCLSPLCKSHQNDPSAHFSFQDNPYYANLPDVSWRMVVRFRGH